MIDQPEALLQRLERLGQDGVGNYGMPICAEAAAELRRLVVENERLHWHELAAEQWIDKTHWVQKTSRPEEIGMHRADVLKQRIEKLEAVNAELLGAMISFTNSAYIKKHHPKRYAAAMAAIAKAEGQK
jgi:hypothetical protein